MLMGKKDNIKIAPSILSADFWKLGQEIAEVEDAGADMLHIDVMDGHFVPNITMGPPIVNSIKKNARIPLDVHLMIENPEKYIPDFVDAGSDILTVHVETCSHLEGVVSSIKRLGIKAGVVFNPATPLIFLDHVLEQVDMVLLMSVNPGFGGQQFLLSVLPKIEKLREKMDNAGLNTDIQVDGGINQSNCRSVVEAGANVLVAGSSVFHSANYKETIAELRSKKLN